MNNYCKPEIAQIWANLSTCLDCYPANSCYLVSLQYCAPQRGRG